MKRMALLLTVLAVCVSSCSYGAYMFNISETKVDERATTLKTDVAVPTVPGSVYSFLIIADAHFGSSSTNSRLKQFKEQFTALFDTADAGKKPQFIINLGDIMDSAEQRQADDYLTLEREIREIAKEKLGVTDYPSYAVIGNHDLYASDGWDVWKNNFYPHTSYYTFKIGKFAYYFLDTGNATLGNPQLEDLERHLSADPDTPKIMLQHYPIVLNISSFCLQNTLERNRLLRDYAKSNVRMIFSGHYHPGNSNNFGDFKEKTVKSFGYNDVALLVTVDDSTETITYEEIDFGK